MIMLHYSTSTNMKTIPREKLTGIKEQKTVTILNIETNIENIYKRHQVQISH